MTTLSETLAAKQLRDERAAEQARLRSNADRVATAISNLLRTIAELKCSGIPDSEGPDALSDVHGRLRLAHFQAQETLQLHNAIARG